MKKLMAVCAVALCAAGCDPSVTVTDDWENNVFTCRFDEDSVGKLVSATTVETPSNCVVTIVFSKVNP